MGEHRYSRSIFTNEHWFCNSLSVQGLAKMRLCNASATHSVIVTIPSWNGPSLLTIAENKVVGHSCRHILALKIIEVSHLNCSARHTCHVQEHAANTFLATHFTNARRVKLKLKFKYSLLSFCLHRYWATISLNRPISNKLGLQTILLIFSRST